MALAGFGKDDIEVEVADSTLSVRSAKVPLNEDVSKDDTVYRGISRRKFDRKFTLAEDVIVNGAELANGMLILELERVVPEAKKPRLIDIK
jgi:molecular chaperone IbpA